MTTSLHSPAPWIALLPLGVYFLCLSWAHLRRRPLAVSGVFDVAMLAAGVSGLAVVGPLALLVPVTGGSPWSWPVLAFLFVLCVATCVLVSRPRMVVYNITVEQFRPLVAEVVSALDPGARWAGESAALPDRGFQLHIEGNGPMRTVSIVNVGERSSAEGWGEFTRRLRRAVGGLRVRRSPWGALFAAVGGGLLVLAAALAIGPTVWAAVRPWLF
ncbi:MAG: hypothetical protein ACKOHK_05680 [Planctomycetia bacterium]